MEAPALAAVMERRIPVNYRVDPDLLGSYLPTPFRPVLVGGHGVAGVCLIRLGRIRPVAASGPLACPLPGCGRRTPPNGRRCAGMPRTARSPASGTLSPGCAPSPPRAGRSRHEHAVGDSGTSRAEISLSGASAGGRAGPCTGGPTGPGRAAGQSAYNERIKAAAPLMRAALALAGRSHPRLGGAARQVHGTSPTSACVRQWRRAMPRHCRQD